MDIYFQHVRGGSKDEILYLHAKGCYTPKQGEESQQHSQSMKGIDPIKESKSKHFS